MNIELFREYCMSLPLATEDMPFDDTVVVFRLKVNKKLPKRERVELSL